MLPRRRRAHGAGERLHEIDAGAAAGVVELQAGGDLGGCGAAA